VLAAAAAVMALTYLCALLLMPAGQRALSDKLVDIRADMAGALLNEGEFNNQSQGLTVFIGALSGNGEIRNILVHNSREKDRPVTYVAEKGILAQTPAGTRLIMFDGTNAATPVGSLYADANGNIIGIANTGGSANEGAIYEVTNSGYVTGEAAAPEPASMVLLGSGMLGLAALRRRWRRAG
jgi:lipopolysaccharide export LptBFGC system permease protein LptF